MTIRTAVLRGSLALVLGAILLSAALSFYEFRQSLQAEIARNLRASAGALLERIDAFFFERLEDIREWRRLELLQDIRVGDVDKRLAHLLGDLAAGHGGVYRGLFCTDLDGKVIAATDGTLIGTQRSPRPALVTEPSTAGVAIVLERLEAPDQPSLDRVVMRTSIPNIFGDGVLGYLYAVLNWQEVRRFLADAVRGSGRTALLLETGGRVLAASGSLAELGQPDGATLADWARNAVQPDAPMRKALSNDGRLLLGAAASSGYQHFRGFGWRLLMAEPTRIAFAPVFRLAWAILGVLLLTLAVAGWFSLRVSARIARPIGELTDFARALHPRALPAPPSIDTGLTEVGELSRAFAGMIAALERSREHLVRAAKLAVVGEMAAIMAHEVRTPLGILKSSAQLLDRRPELAPEARELTAFITSETERLGHLVSTLLECGTPRPPNFQPHDLHEIVAHAVALVGSRAGKKDVVLAQDLAASDPMVHCDREQIMQALLNLLINAIQLVPAGSHVSVRTAARGGVLSLRVEDDGPGIPAELRERIFDPFFTRRQGGIGLGLTIVQQIVQAHRGEIVVTEGRGSGACFIIRLSQNEGGLHS